jgi:glutathione S-transferase
MWAPSECVLPTEQIAVTLGSEIIEAPLVLAAEPSSNDDNGHPDTGISLWGNHMCPFVQRVRIALAEKGLPFVEKRVDVIGDKDARFVELYTNAYPGSNRPAIPLLQHNLRQQGVSSEVVLPESTVILQYLDEVFDSPTTLTPTTAAQRARGRLFVQLVQNEIMPLQAQVLNAADMQALTKAVDSMKRGLRAVEAFLVATTAEHSSALPFVCEGRFTMAEAITAPHFLRLICTVPQLRPQILRLTSTSEAPAGSSGQSGLLAGFRDELTLLPFVRQNYPRVYEWALTTTRWPSVVSTFDATAVSKIMSRAVAKWSCKESEESAKRQFAAKKEALAGGLGALLQRQGGGGGGL